jgi:hypothetical protein
VELPSHKGNPGDEVKLRVPKVLVPANDGGKQFMQRQGRAATEA